MRVFSEAEIAVILKRAAERQAAAHAPPSAGLTLAEIEALAAEAGLDVAHVRDAAAELAPAWPAVRSRSATHVFVERTLGVPLTDEGWDELVADLRNRYGKAGMAAYLPSAAPSGDVAVVGKNREWSHTDGLGVETRVLVTERGAASRLRLSQRVGMMGPFGDAVLIGLSLAVLPALAAFNLLPGAVGAGVAAGVAALGVALVWALDVAWRRTMHDRLAGVSDSLAAILHAHSTTAAAERAGPALSLDALGDAPSATGDPDRVPDADRRGARA